MNNDAKANHLYNQHNQDICVEIAALVARKSKSNSKAIQAISKFCTVSRKAVESRDKFSIATKEQKLDRDRDCVLDSVSAASIDVACNNPMQSRKWERVIKYAM